MKEFLTAVKTAADSPDAIEGAPLPFKVDGKDFLAEPPTEGQIAAMLSGASDMSSTSEKVASALNFFFSVLHDDDVAYFKRRLFDRDDPFGAGEIAEIVAWLVEEWAGRPTKQPSDYTPSQQNGGPRSTGQRRHKASTHSSSGQIASAT